MMSTADEVRLRGFSIVSGLASADELTRIESELSDFNGYAARDLLRKMPSVRDFAWSEPVLAVMRSLIGEEAFPVRGLLFDKNPQANWLVPWHQDLTICVDRRIDVPGYQAWSMKAGLIHVQPPASVLESMAALRLHLDDCAETNGALRVMPGTHLHGRLSSPDIAGQQNTIGSVTCEVRRGDVILMKPLLLHASSAAISPGRRRVIHIEYAACDLEGGLKWREDRDHTGPESE